MRSATRFFLAEAPRNVPVSLRMVLLLGGLGQLGWALFCFGLIFVLVFLPNADFRSWVAFGESEHVTARVTGVDQTSFSVGGGEHRRGTPVYAYHFTFGDEQGETHSGTSYATGHGYDTGATVRVEYPRGRPELATIVGMRRRPMPPWTAFVVIFPLVGLVFVVVRLRNGLKAGRLLRDGSLGLAKLIEKRATNTRINNRCVYRMSFEFTDEAGLKQGVVARTTEPERLEDAAEETLLYDPRRPHCAVLMDNLPGRPQVDEIGHFRPAGRRAAWLCALPVLAVAELGAFVVLMS